MKAALAFLLLSLVAAGPAASQCMGNASATQRGILKAQKPVLLLAQSVGPAVVATEMDLSDLLMQRVREAARLGLFSREINKTRTKIKEIAREPVSLSLPPAIKEKTHRVPMMSEENLKELSPELRDHLLRESRRYVFFDASREEEAAWAATLASENPSAPVPHGAIASLLKSATDLPFLPTKGACMCAALPLTLCRVSSRSRRAKLW